MRKKPFINEDVFVAPDVLLQYVFELANGNALVARYAKVTKHARPCAGAAFIKEARRRDDEAAAIINAISAAMSADDLVGLNLRSVDEELAPAEIAADWLAAENLN